jgi:uncharacterized phage-associated protein
MSSVRDVSTYIIQKSAPISNLKLQKLLYYVQGWSLALNDAPAFNDRIEAWVHGPVVPTAFYEYRGFGWNPIELGAATAFITDAEKSHIDDVLSVYGAFTATQLESLSHEESPWLDARGALDPKAPSKNEISHEAMKKFFLTRINA